MELGFLMAEVIVSWIVGFILFELVSSSTIHERSWQRRKAAPALSAKLAARSPLATAASQQTSRYSQERSRLTK